jgi:hypothetical protein
MMCTPLLSQDLDTTGRGMLSRCKEATEDQPPQRMGYLQGFCSGVVLSTIVYSPGRLVCHPADADVTDGVRVLVKYMEENPQELQEDISLLSIKALHQAWPC